MLLRRIINNLKAQNWAAVTLDLAVVFVGIFGAFQVDRWYAERQLRSDESSHLRALMVDFQASRSILERDIGLHQGVLDAAAVLLAYEPNSSIDITGDEFYELMRQVQYMGQWEPQSRAYDTLIASGEIRAIGDEELKADLAEYFSRAERADARRNEMIMQRVTSFEPYLNNRLDHAAMLLKVHPSVSETIGRSLPPDQFKVVLGTGEFEGVIVQKMHASYDARSYLGRMLDLNTRIESRISKNLNE